ncbi:MAG TPA: hypothetical protein VMY77_03165 [Chitinophagaceae bacterium]|nr:hypothetical protein [Chitinophagaceae bacterium]
MKDFINKNRVMIFGLLSSIIAGVTAVMTPEMTTVDWLTLGYAALMAALSWGANNLRGKWVSLAGIFTTLAAAVTTAQTNPDINWSVFLVQLLLSLLGAIIAVVAPPPKPSTYEHDSTIVEAKVNPDIR